MFNIVFIENMSDSEIKKLVQVFKNIGKDNHWKIIRALLKEKDLTQAELRLICNYSNISNDICYLVEQGIVLEEYVYIDRQNKHKKYTLNRHRVNELYTSETQEFVFNYQKLFNREVPYRDYL